MTRFDVDRCSVEIFADDGAAYLAALVSPSPESRHVGIFAEGGTVHLRPLTLYPMLPD